VSAPSEEALEELLAAAGGARSNAYAPYSGFSVGAAVLAGGRVFTGANVEIASYPISVCAERSAISAMVAAGERSIDAVAVMTDAEEPTPPCGGCRQAIWEFGREAVVVSAAANGSRLRSSIRELLPHAFGAESFRPEDPFSSGLS
jgi:cytidine deaminase